MEVRDLAVQFRVRGATRPGARRRLARVAPRRDPRRRRRVGLRQVDAGAGDARPARARRPARSRSTASAVDGQARPRRAAPARADDLPGPLPDAQPAPAGGGDRRRAAAWSRASPAAEHEARVRRRARGRRAGSRALPRAATRTSSPAASASGWRSPRRSCSSPRG